MEENEIAEEWNPLIFTKVEKLELTKNCSYCLQKEGFVYIGELIQKSQEEMEDLFYIRLQELDLKEDLRTLAGHCLFEIREILYGVGLCFDTKLWFGLRTI